MAFKINNDLTGFLRAFLLSEAEEEDPLDSWTSFSYRATLSNMQGIQNFQDLVLREIGSSCAEDAYKVDGSFTTDKRLVPEMKHGTLSYFIKDMPLRRKEYPNEADASEFINNTKRTMFLAYVGDSLAGQIIVETWWNGFASIDDLRVAAQFRRFGVGRALVRQAEAWAVARGLPGLRLETQDINLGACLFYEHCGFTLAGFDQLLYRATPGCEDEVALFWYKPA